MSEFNFPPDMTREPPDHVDFDTHVIGWEFEVGGKKAVRGFIQPNFEGVLPESEVGQQITLINSPPRGTSLTMTELKDGQETERIYFLSEDDEQVYIPPGRELSIAAGSRIVEYVRVYLGKPKKPVSGKRKDRGEAKPTPGGGAAIGEDLPLPVMSPDEASRLRKLLHEASEGVSHGAGFKTPNRGRHGQRGK
jgi:hypothetical protein